MRTLIVTSLLAVVLGSTVVPASAQTASLPQPVAVVKDADGKVIAQVAGFFNTWPRVILDVEGTPAFLIFQPFGLVDRVGLQHEGSVFFSEVDCTGSPYVNQVGEDVEFAAGANFGVAGPDPTAGDYRLFRSTTMVVSTVSLRSKWAGGVCVNFGPQNQGVLPAEEVIPNPLAGFHGPTLANPERKLTISGGDRIQ